MRNFAFHTADDHFHVPFEHYKKRKISIHPGRFFFYLDFTLFKLVILYTCADTRKRRRQNCFMRSHGSQSLTIPPKYIYKYLVSFLVHTFNFCIEECLQNMDFPDILISGRKFVVMSQWNQQRWILDYLCDHSKQEDSSVFLNN